MSHSYGVSMPEMKYDKNADNCSKQLLVKAGEEKSAKGKRQDLLTVKIHNVAHVWTHQRDRERERSSDTHHQTLREVDVNI